MTYFFGLKIYIFQGCQRLSHKKMRIQFCLLKCNFPHKFSKNSLDLDHFILRPKYSKAQKKNPTDPVQCSQCKYVMENSTTKINNFSNTIPKTKSYSVAITVFGWVVKDTCYNGCNV